MDQTCLPPELLKTVPEVAKATKEVLPQTTSAIDTALSNIIGFLSAPVAYLNAHSDFAIKQTKKKLQERLKNIPSEKIVSPEPYIAVPTLQAISYSANCEELHDMFATLLATTMNKDKKNIAHPAFVEIIKQLTPLEARLLHSDEFAEESIPLCDFLVQQSSKLTETAKENFYLEKSDKPHLILVSDIFVTSKINDIDLKEMSSVISNFYRLGLYKEIKGNYVHEKRYDAFTPLYNRVKEELYEPFRKNNPEIIDISLHTIPKIMRLTNLGMNFRRACID